MRYAKQAIWLSLAVALLAGYYAVAGFIESGASLLTVGFAILTVAMLNTAWVCWGVVRRRGEPGPGRSRHEPEDPEHS